MINTTIVSLHMMSLMYTSPLYTIRNHYNGLMRTSIFNSHFSHMFTNIVASYTRNHQTIFRNDIFSHSLSTPLKFESEYDCGIDSTKVEVVFPIQNKIISNDKFNDDWEDKRAYFLSECGSSISIYFCIFQSCFSKENYGGSLIVKQDCSVVIHSTQFIDSHSATKRGGACAIAKNFDDTVDVAYIKDEQLTSLNVQYCCFSGCYPDSDNEEHYGLALFCASKDTVVYFSSTVNCPPDDKNYKSGGAQIDIQSDHVKSKNVNITGGKAKFCGGIEYRYATKGHFKFQTISKIKECMFATSFTDININNLELSFSNYDSNKLVNNAEETDVNLYPALIHIREKDIAISNFCFTNFIPDDNNKAKIVSRGTYYDEDEKAQKEEKIKITLINCYRDSSISDDQVGIKNVDGSEMLFGEVQQIKNLTPNKIDQLLLGNCHGAFQPGDEIIIEDVNEPTDSFTNSDKFSKTFEFTKSDGFSNSNVFSKSFEFTLSDFLPKINDKDVDGGGGNQSEDDKLPTGAKIGIGVGVAAAAVIIVAVVIFFIRKSRLSHLQEEDIDVQDETNSSTVTQNPLTSIMEQDDPFKEEFQ